MKTDICGLICWFGGWTWLDDCPLHRRSLVLKEQTHVTTVSMICNCVTSEASLIHWVRCCNQCLRYSAVVQSSKAFCGDGPWQPDVVYQNLSFPDTPVVCCRVSRGWVLWLDGFFAFLSPLRKKSSPCTICYYKEPL